MEKKVEKELDDVKNIINNWIKSYRLLFNGKGNNLFWYEELCKDIEDHGVMKYIQRFIEMEHITPEEANKFGIEVREKLKEFYEECVKKDEENGK